MCIRIIAKIPRKLDKLLILYHGEKEGGVTVHYMNEQLDAGDIILQKRFPLRGQVLSLQCFTKKTAHFAGEVLLKALHLLKKKKVRLQKIIVENEYFLPRKEETERFGRMFRFVRFRKFLEWF